MGETAVVEVEVGRVAAPDYDSWRHKQAADPWMEMEMEVEVEVERSLGRWEF